MSRSTTPATRNEATRRWKTPKVTPFAELPIGTAIRPSRGHFRTVANGCGRLRTVADGCGRKRNVRRTQLYRHTPRVKREPLLRIREKRDTTPIYLILSILVHSCKFWAGFCGYLPQWAAPLLGFYGRKPHLYGNCSTQESTPVWYMSDPDFM